MFARSFKLFLLSLLALAGLAPGLAAQSADKVKSDVLAAMSTPLPITIIGPLLTRDVEVTPEGGGFRARMSDTTLMGLFPFGEVSFHLDALDEDTYRISDLRFPKLLDFPGMGRVTFSDMQMEGTWSASRRSYSALKWTTGGLEFLPGQGDQGRVSIGQLSFDVLKEPDDTNTESRFAISASDVAIEGLAPEDVSVGKATVLLAANGDKPVDLYSVVREVMVLSSVRDGGTQFRTLGNSLLGNSYESVVLDLSASGLSIVSRYGPDGPYLNAAALEAKATLGNVAPRNWGSAEVVLSLEGIDQKEFVPESNTTAERAIFRLSGENMPVADMFAALRLLRDPPRHRAVPAARLLDGLAEFGKLEFSSEGKAVTIEVLDQRMGDDGVRKSETVFETGYDGWVLKTGLSGFDRNEGRLSLGADFTGGHFTPGKRIPEEARMHLDAWFPVGLKLQTSVSNLNEALLKKMFADVEFQDLNEPVEAALPLALYAAAAVFDIESGENSYETGLFRLTENGAFRFYPAEFFALFPYEGKAVVSLSGLENLLGYFDRSLAQVRPGSSEATGLNAARSGLIVMRNLAQMDAAGSYHWQIARADVTRREIELNGITLRYPDLMQYLPILFTLGSL